MKRWIPVLVVVMGLGAGLAIYDAMIQLPKIPEPSDSRAQRGLPVISVELPDGTRIAAEVAWKADQQAHGLMFRDQVPPLTGMLFVHEEDSYQHIWMKNTLVNLDLIWINEMKRVKLVTRNVPRSKTGEDGEKIMRTGYGKYVLELKAGEAARLNISKGTVLKFQWP